VPVLPTPNKSNAVLLKYYT